MARRHPTGWEVLGFSEDPTPGDPEAIRNLSRNYRELGDGAGEALGLLRDDGRIRQGKGQAMDALKERIKELPGMLEDTRDSFQRAATAYDDYANTLTEAQSMLDRAIDQGQEVAATANAEPPAQAPPDATPEQVEAREGEVDRINGAKQQLSAAQSLGRDAERLREDGSRRASVVLDDAASKAIPERGSSRRSGTSSRTTRSWRSSRASWSGSSRSSCRSWASSWARSCSPSRSSGWPPRASSTWVRS